MINLLLAIHNHQPVGNFEHVFTKAFKECYFPVLDILEKFPKVKMSIHHSGPLLDWAQKHEPSYLPKLVHLIKNGQVEPLGGGYYEPILAVIPPQDASGQLKMMCDFWKAEAGIKPRGIWLTERIWEPSLASLLAENDVGFTILDDEHFRASGMTEEFILNYYLAERHGNTVAIYASDQTLRYYIPFKLPEEVIGHLKYLGEKYPNACVTYGDDGEKFGLWPGTHEWVINQGWLKKFFTQLSENTDKIRTQTFSEHLSSNKPNGNVYFPTCSYHEMGEWAMPAHAIHRFNASKKFLEDSGKWGEAKPFLRGGYWDNFFTKYPESNYMHKRMLYVSKKLSKLKGEITASAHAEATKALYRSQCNCAYWHGLFGGLYLNYLRNAIFKNIIESENLIDAPDISKPKSEICDIDCDRFDEVILKNEHLISVIKPNKDGSLQELSLRNQCLNILDVMTRREEAYHKKNSETASSEQSEKNSNGIPSIHDIHKNVPNAKALVYDACPRRSFLDHVWVDNADRQCNRSFDIISHGDNFVLLKNTNNEGVIEKRYQLDGSGLTVKYKLTFPNPIQKEIRFGTEINLTLLAGHDSGRYYNLPLGKEFMDAQGSQEKIDKLILVDEYFKFNLEISSDKKMDVVRYPINTVSQSESGFDLLYQGSCIIWSALVPKESGEFSFEINLNFIRS